MKWEIDTKAKHLSLDGHYHISFDRLTEDDWFRHLSEKGWVDMREILAAFIAAYDAAGIPLSRKFFDRYKFAFFARSEGDYENNIHAVCNDRLYGGEHMWSLSHLSRDSDTCIQEILEDIDGMYNFSKSDILAAIYDVGDDSYSKSAIRRAISAVTNELQSPMSPEISIFEYRMPHWLRVPNCGRKTTDLIMQALESLIGSRGV